MHIGLMGRARSGKDTAGAYLTEAHGYRRVSFADPLREAALKLDPIIDPDASDYGAATLSMVVGDFGWERAKDDYPEVRRILQHMGQGVRDLDPEFWIRQALRKVDEAEGTGLPCVVTDVRYPNEVAALHRRGFHLVYIDRPGVGPANNHVSESAVDPGCADEVILNDGDLHALSVKVEQAWRLAYDRNVRRQYSRSYD